MDFLKFLMFNILLVSSQVYCDQLKLSCVQEGSDTYVSGFDARFYLSTGKNRANKRIKSKGNNLKTFLNERGFKNNLKTVVLIHGFLNDHKASWVAELKGNLTRKLKLNVIQMDWSNAFFNKHIEVDEDYDVIEAIVTESEGVVDYFYYDDGSDEGDEGDEGEEDDDSIIPEELNPLDYKSAALRTELAAIKLTALLVRVAKTRPNPKKFLKNLHLIGHSLGSHVAGQTGRLLRKHAKVQVNRITGLDPAYPCFDPEKNPELKLDVNDAKFVDVIHTNSRPDKSNPNFGTYESLGHMDFYPHGGHNQPNCDLNRKDRFSYSWTDLVETMYDTVDFLTKTILNVNATGIVLNYGSSERFDIICDHGEAPNYFTQSLSRDIYAVPITILHSDEYDENMIENLKNQLRTCARTKNCVRMGYYAIDSADKPGNYYADTTI